MQNETTMQRINYPTIDHNLLSAGKSLKYFYFKLLNNLILFRSSI